jgi:hypothetical protein
MLRRARWTGGGGKGKGEEAQELDGPLSRRHSAVKAWVSAKEKEAEDRSWTGHISGRICTDSWK